MKKVLESDPWLSDEHMQLAQDLLRDQFPHIDGLQSTLLGQTNGYIATHTEGNYKC